MVGPARRFLSVHRAKHTADDTRSYWYLAWANPTPSGLGHSYEPALPGEYRTKKLALAAKRDIVTGGGR